MNTAPGAGSGGSGNEMPVVIPVCPRVPAAAIAAANSARSGDTPATPTPPTTCPWRYRGSPPGLTGAASGSPESNKSALPVVMPTEHPALVEGLQGAGNWPAALLNVPAIDRGAGIDWPGLKTASPDGSISQPLFVFSMP